MLHSQILLITAWYTSPVKNAANLTTHDVSGKAYHASVGRAQCSHFRHLWFPEELDLGLKALMPPTLQLTGLGDRAGQQLSVWLLWGQFRCRLRESSQTCVQLLNTTFSETSRHHLWKNVQFQRLCIWIRNIKNNEERNEKYFCTVYFSIYNFPLDMGELEGWLLLTIFCRR